MNSLYEVGSNIPRNLPAHPAFHPAPAHTRPRMFSIPIWRRLPLRVQGLVFNSLPLLAVLLTATFAFFSNQQREHVELSVNRHFEMVENLVDIQTQLLAAEAGLRGYLLRDELALLQPCKEALEGIPQKFARITVLLQSISKPVRRTEKLARFAIVREPIEGQLKTLASLLPSSPSDRNLANFSDQSLLQASSLRVAHLRDDEQRLLAKRLEEIRSVRHRDFLLIFLSIGVGLASRAVALYFFHRRVVRRVRQLTENARSLRDGSALVHEPSDHTDDIGELERELALIGDYLAERRWGKVDG